MTNVKIKCPVCDETPDLCGHIKVSYEGYSDYYMAVRNSARKHRATYKMMWEEIGLFSSVPEYEHGIQEDIYTLTIPEYVGILPPLTLHEIPHKCECGAAAIGSTANSMAHSTWCPAHAK